MVAPVVSIAAGRYSRVEETPLIRWDCTKKFVSEAPGAVMLMELPLGRWMTASGNSGLLKTRSAVPGVTGYMPSDCHTKDAVIVPRSSLSPKVLALNTNIM